MPESKVSVKFEVRRPPLEATAASRALASHGVAIYQELGLPMKVVDRASGGGTDAAFAALKARGPVIEGMGLSGFGAHSMTRSTYRSAASCRGCTCRRA